MTEQEHYSLRWNNHQNHILRAFDTLLKTKSLVDVTLVCAESRIRAHKVVLSACSPFFQNVFAENPCKHPVIVLKDYPGWVVQAVVDFMYRGEISVPQKQLETLIQVGESLQIRGLVEHRFAAENLSFESTNNTEVSERSPLSNASIEADDTASKVEDSVTITPRNGTKPTQELSTNTHTKREETEDNTNCPFTNSTATINHNNHSNENRESNCTSPMPRRKQARPRRRSGECGPHEYDSQPNSPEQDDMETCDKRSSENENETNELRQYGERVNAIDCTTNCDKDKIVDCTAAAMEQSLIRSKLNQNDVDTSDNELDDDDEEGNDLGVHDMHADDIEQDEDDDMDEDEDDVNDIGKMALEAREALRKRPRSYMCEEENLSGPENDEDDDCDGPENLCIKNNQNSSRNDDRSSSTDKGPHTKRNNNNNRIGLSLKDIRHLNRPSHYRHGLFPGFPSHLSMKDDHMPKMDHMQKPNDSRAQHSLQQHGQRMEHGPHNSQSFLEASENLKREALEGRLEENAYMEQVEMSLAAAAAAAAAAHHHNAGLHHPNSRHPDLENMHKDFTPGSPMSLQSHFNQREGPPHPPSPLQFPGMSSALGLTPPHHMFGLDSSLPLFPPGMDPSKLYNPLLEMSDPRAMHPNPHGPYLKKKSKLGRPKGQHSAPRGGPPRSWTNAELTEALHHVWNKKMTTSQASRLFGIPYNSLLMYVRGKYGKSLNLEQLRKGCISGPPIELLTMGLGAHSNNNGSQQKNMGSSRNGKEHKDLDDGGRHERDIGRAGGSGSLKRSTSSSEPDLLSNPNIFNPFPPGFYTDFPGGFPLPLSMLNLLPPDRHPPSMHGLPIDEDCKSDRSKQSLEDDYPLAHALSLSRDDRRELIQQNGQD